MNALRILTPLFLLIFSLGLQAQVEYEGYTTQTVNTDAAFVSHLRKDLVHRSTITYGNEYATVTVHRWTARNKWLFFKPTQLGIIDVEVIVHKDDIAFGDEVDFGEVEYDGKSAYEHLDLDLLLEVGQYHFTLVGKWVEGIAVPDQDIFIVY